MRVERETKRKKNFTILFLFILFYLIFFFFFFFFFFIFYSLHQSPDLCLSHAMLGGGVNMI